MMRMKSEHTFGASHRRPSSISLILHSFTTIGVEVDSCAPAGISQDRCHSIQYKGFSLRNCIWYCTQLYFTICDRRPRSRFRYLIISAKAERRASVDGCPRSKTSCDYSPSTTTSVCSSIHIPNTNIPLHPPIRTLGYKKCYI